MQFQRSLLLTFLKHQQRLQLLVYFNLELDNNFFYGSLNFMLQGSFLPFTKNPFLKLSLLLDCLFVFKN